MDALEYVSRRGMGALPQRMGIEAVEFTTERAVARMPVEGNTQPVGYVHGGAYVVLAESLGSMHANFICGDNRFAVGIEINASHSYSARDGWVTGVAVPLHVGSSLIVHQVTITNDSGRLCSTVRITNFVKDAPGVRWGLLPEKL